MTSCWLEPTWIYMLLLRTLLHNKWHKKYVRVKMLLFHTRIHDTYFLFYIRDVLFVHLRREED